MILAFIKTYKKIFIFFILLLFTILYFLIKYNKIINDKNIDILVSNQVQIVENELENQKNQILSLALMFSKNQDIIKNLEENNPILLKKELLKLLDIIQTYTKQNSIDVQIHTKDMEVFLRTWEDIDFGKKLEGFREGIVRVKNTNRPFVSSELGKRFNIKAIAPIYNKDNFYIGSIELIVDYSYFVTRLKALGIDSAILLEKDFLDIATEHKQDESLGNFVVLENSFTKGFFWKFKNSIDDIKNNNYYFLLDDKIITKIPLGEFDKKSVGVLVVGFNKDIKNFVYLPKYDYLGDINIKSDKKEIIIR